MDAAFAAIDKALATDHIVCIFPEGGITRDGTLQTFRPGVEQILASRPVNVLPVALKGLWGSWFSRSNGGAMRKWPRRFRAPIEIEIGEPVPASDADAHTLEARVRTLLADDA